MWPLQSRLTINYMTPDILSFVFVLSLLSFPAFSSKIVRFSVSRVLFAYIGRLYMIS